MKAYFGEYYLFWRVNMVCERHRLGVKKPKKAQKYLIFAC